MKSNNNRVKGWLGLGLTPFAVVIHGFVLSKLWALFIVPVFGLPSISIMEAAGIMFVVDFILLKIDWTNDIEKTSLYDFTVKWIAHTFVSPFVILGFGYILAMFL